MREIATGQALPPCRAESKQSLVWPGWADSDNDRRSSARVSYHQLCDPPGNALARAEKRRQPAKQACIKLGRIRPLTPCLNGCLIFQPPSASGASAREKPPKVAQHTHTHPLPQTLAQPHQSQALSATVNDVTRSRQAFLSTMLSRFSHR